jgi:NAD(P)-dependent dehydrogenase (short-subunit alcohol dehydrogenase family)
MDDFKRVVDVHLMGAAHCSKAVWPHMQAQKYGRIVMTTNSTGQYGNFGQANYGAAKMALGGLRQTLSIRERAGEMVPQSGAEQGYNEISKAKQAAAQ